MPSAIKAANRLDKIQVLVLEGSAQAADLLRDVFEKLGFSNVQVVRDGYEGIQAMKKKPVHLVFTDWELRVRKRRPQAKEQAQPADEDIMPLSGAEFIRRLRQSPHSPNPFVPVVMVMGPNAEKHETQARAAGVNEIIAKPLQAEELCQRIISLIDDTRHFITAETYKGPCRRQERKALPAGAEERRKRQVRLVRRRETKGN